MGEHVNERHEKETGKRIRLEGAHCMPHCIPHYILSPGRFLWTLTLVTAVGLSTAATQVSGNEVVVQGNVVQIDGEKVDPAQTHYTSPRTGDKFVIRRSGDSVQVVKVGHSAGCGSEGSVVIRAHASNGGTVNAGCAVATP
jgi:hypothetical protein